MKKRFFTLSLFILLLFTISCMQQTTPNGRESSISETGDIKRIKVTTNKVNVTTGCSEDSPTIQTANKADTFDVVSKVENWYAVKLKNNQIGFVPEENVKPIVPEDDKKTGTTQQTTPETPAKPETTNTNTGIPSENTNTSTLTSQEQEMLRLVNEARAQNNVPALEIDMELTNIARIKSQDMIDNNYFSHNSPTYGSPFDMMKQFGIEYVHAGENIAGNQDVQAAHNALMNSPGHRKNILNSDFTHIGIGIRSGGSYGNMFTQMFISKPQ